MTDVNDSRNAWQPDDDDHHLSNTMVDFKRRLEDTMPKNKSGLPDFDARTRSR